MAKTSTVSVITTELSRMPGRFRSARKSVLGLQRQALRTTKRRPARSLLGAFAIGIAVARLARLVTA
jgi:hypothetical protein